MKGNTPKDEHDLINELNSLILSIKSAKPGITEEVIAKELGYKPGHIAQSRSRKKVSKRFVDGLNQYLERLKNATHVPLPIKTQTEDQTLGEPMMAYIESRRSLERTLENLTADKIKSTSIIEELVGMLKANYPAKPSIPPGFNAPGSEASQTLTKGKKAN